MPAPFAPDPRRGRPRAFGDIAQLLGRLPSPSQAIARIRLARRRFGSWRNVVRQLSLHLVAEGLAATLARFRNYGAALPGLPPEALIEARYAVVRAEIASRLAVMPPVPAGSSDIADGPLISLVMPTYRVPIDLLDRTIASVSRQSYPRWELCVADDGSDQTALADRLRQHAAREPRIKLHLSATNSGIAAASNQALALASGAFVGFLDHDDLLTQDALRCVAEAIVAEPDIDILYTDECKIDDRDQPHDIFCKPDWSPVLLFNGMYLGHLAVYRRTLIEDLGGLRSRYDFSQDYDLALRATERPVKVHHIERVLYGWRMAPGSGAVGDKPFARASNIAALQDALDRRGYPAEAVALPRVNHARWQRAALTGKVSIIIPSDDADRILESIRSIRRGTDYADYELLVVSGAAIADAVALAADASDVRFVRYDAVFNFSAKCNAGAAQATGEYIIFHGDAVRVITPDWIETLLACLRIDGVGAVSPKLLYEDGTIRHAGSVSGVRRLIGTAFHRFPADTGVYFNFAQSVREVSSLSGACLVMPARLFRALNGFDTTNTPICHSDVDLCFRLRQAGYRCVYVPHTTLRYTGYQALAVRNPDVASQGAVCKDKADIHLLRRWPTFLARDPFYPPAMKALLYADSPQDFDIYPASPAGKRTGLDILILSHDLSGGEASRITHDMATLLCRAGHFVIIMSPNDGAVRHDLVAAGVTVLIDKLLLAQYDDLHEFARNFDRVIANSVVPWPAVLQLARVVEVCRDVHEANLIADSSEDQSDFVRATDEAGQT